MSSIVNISFRFLTIFASFVQLNDAVDIQCSVGTWSGIKYCEISSSNLANAKESDTFRFNVTDKEKIAVQGLRFYTNQVKFIPREAVETFPNLFAIFLIPSISHKVLRFEQYRNLLKFVKSKVTFLNFYDGYVEKIDPRMIGIFKKMKKIDLTLNSCGLKSVLYPENGDYELKSALKHCVDQYMSIYAADFNWWIGESLYQTQETCDSEILEFSNLNLEFDNSHEHFKHEIIHELENSKTETQELVENIRTTILLPIFGIILVLFLIILTILVVLLKIFNDSLKLYNSLVDQVNPM